MTTKLSANIDVLVTRYIERSITIECEQNLLILATEGLKQ
jgi:hypothetical protein